MAFSNLFHTPPLNTQLVVWGMKFNFFFGKKLSNVRVKQVVWCVKKAPNEQRGNEGTMRRKGVRTQVQTSSTKPKLGHNGGVGTNHIPNPHSSQEAYFNFF
jgi:hypothetical protein